ncbi:MULTISPECIES: hypothetical protein [unclassified Brevundimonas]|uniref:hypothetical protein n=1 Tax=unclassified Brevundimonas TaxID=2622653 RepID=UPI003F93E144
MRGLISIVLLASLAACTPRQPEPAKQTESAPAAVQVETPIAPAESAVAPEIDPPGDIPDSQVFVSYQSVAGGYWLDVPEGWSRTENGSDASFVQRFDGVSVAVAPAAAAPTVASARAGEAARIIASGRAVTITDVSAVALPAGKAVVIRYTSNSEPNAVTNNRVRLENEAFLLFNNGRMATLTLWAPQGADNVDQWTRMSRSFRWR